MHVKKKTEYEQQLAMTWVKTHQVQRHTDDNVKNGGRGGFARKILYHHSTS